MYRYLSGKIIEKTATVVVLDVNGVGYEIHIPVSTFSGLPSLGEEVRLLITFIVREDAQVLYGFLSEDEKMLFGLLISVSGIGPKIALTALSGVRIEQLKKAIVKGEVEVLRGIPGIGKKTAERIVVELREKLVLEDDGQTPGDSSIDGADALIEDSLQALMALGYKRPQAKKAIDKVIGNADAENLSVEDLIRDSLQHV